MIGLSGFRRLKALTLMEVIIVVAIVATMVAVGYPSFNRVKLETRREDAKGSLVSLEGVIERYLIENNKALFGSTDLASSTFANYDASSSTPVYSKRNYYRLTIATDSTGYILTATAVANSASLTSCNSSGNANVGQCADLKCRKILIDHGAKTSIDSSGAAANATTTVCWK